MAEGAGPSEGVLLQSPGSRHGDKVFFCWRGRRHWVSDAAWLPENGFSWPVDVQQVSPGILDAFLPARNAPRSWGEREWRSPTTHNTSVMREICVSRLRGRGIEIGAGASPMPVPLFCDVQYVDMYDEDGLRKEVYAGQVASDLIAPDIVAPFEDLSVVPDSSVDFVVTCHVIEHSRDPIGSIAGAWRKLKTDGSLVLVVPEMTRTFDRDRALTPLDHLIEDYYAPDPTRLRDQDHFREFYSKAFGIPADQYDATWRAKWEAAYPIHYHTWTHDTFGDMIRWMARDGIIDKLADVWSQPSLPDPDECIEFWYVLKKSD
jgi:hypothetical protein